MTERRVRMVAAVLAAFVALLLAGSSSGVASPRAGCDVAHKCVHAATSATASADPCLSAPSCGGGGAPMRQFTPATQPIDTAAVLSELSPLGDVRRVRERAPSTGRLADGGLFRPPRLAV